MVPNLRTSSIDQGAAICKVKEDMGVLAKRDFVWIKEITCLPSANARWGPDPSDKTRDISHGAPWPEFLDLEDLDKKHLDPYESSLDTLLPIDWMVFPRINFSRPRRTVSTSGNSGIELLSKTRSRPSAHLFLIFFFVVSEIGKIQFLIPPIFLDLDPGF